MSGSYKKGDRIYPKMWRFLYAYLIKTKDGKTFIRGTVEEDTILKKGTIVMIFPAKTRAKAHSPQYYGFHQPPLDPNPIDAPVDKPESDEESESTPIDPADEF